ncbi:MULTISPECIES: flagellar biosynthesis regulator FlaF [Thioclava]|uniref:flagellar biosynthesis regulator FlaF n=1 Tax=Thioclava TaxID=285107 RepID=UPI000B53D239|nr:MULTISPECIES: flagellar biosynthesis regulator FlaF [Thioclava]OWY07728.1 flagellar biosynthesis regulator FlhF [Thioclava sp. F42-5]WGT48692.1 flagellar biosynthesis regulator FlaF [Thioclava nitratireducens]
MYATTLAKTAYSNPSQPMRTPRGLEFELFARITRRLKQVSSQDVPFAALAEAIFENRRLWTALAADVADSENGLPQDLRARIFFLNEFTQAHSRLVLSEKRSVDVLIDVNTAIMRGLRQEGIKQ